MEKRTLHLLTLDPMKGKSFLTSNISYNKIVKRGMRSMAFTVVKPNLVKVSHGVLTNNLKSSMSHIRNCKFKKGSSASKDLSSDESGNHVHRIKENCDKQDCEKKICPNLCSTRDKISTEGHYTHNPIPGKFSRHLGDSDANGNEKSQYYTRNGDKTKEVSGTKAKNYHNNKEIKNTTKMDNYTSDPQISKKLDE